MTLLSILIINCNFIINEDELKIEEEKKNFFFKYFIWYISDLIIKVEFNHYL